MAIVEVRIDDRLIHGQVCGYWIPHFNVDKIVIADDKICNDELRKTALKFGCPSKVKLSILSAATAADKLKRNLDKGSRVMILCEGPAPLRKMVELGYPISKITVGNMANKPGTGHVKGTVYVSEQDKEDFKYLSGQGVQLVSQMVPNEPPVDLNQLIKGL
ncbi:PTS transporter subunit IIB [Bacillus coagulans]|uniref:PTS system, mannose-specific IIB component n=1 Tax=Heyndrickxia coagulans TaxID=1398 RepID=A0A150KIC3_HEYCO|nr:PTS sugar transporter subunit IIB [Heyndrickxia coagulans]KYC73246.1 PTS system, mannose-specific IIB component [Heyndrickxia coagulans]NCG68841.1 PTS transporter subunit IIB [Heyndrickxia coagulans]